MTCHALKGGGFICTTPFYRLRLLDGRYVFMMWHSYFGPEFFRDRLCNQDIDEWWHDEFLCRAVEWFDGRGFRA